MGPAGRRLDLRKPRPLLLVLAWALCGIAVPASGLAQGVELVVADPYIEMHTGPGLGYPVFFVVERGARIQVLRSRTDWFEITASGGQTGWADREQMSRTLTPEGGVPMFSDPQLREFQDRRRELGALSGDFDGASVINLYGAYAVTRNLSAELAWSEVLGRFSSSRLLAVNLSHQPFPDWRYSPYFSLGTGAIEVRPAPTLVQAEDRDDRFNSVGVGVRAYLARRFLLRLDYRQYVVFTRRDDNEEPREWKLGFGFFF